MLKYSMLIKFHGTEDNALFEHIDINSGTSSNDDEFLGFDNEDFSGFEDD